MDYDPKNYGGDAKNNLDDDDDDFEEDDDEDESGQKDDGQSTGTRKAKPSNIASLICSMKGKINEVLVDVSNILKQ